jgi:hypothetical protein
MQRSSSANPKMAATLIHSFHVPAHDVLDAFVTGADEYVSSVLRAAQIFWRLHPSMRASWRSERVGFARIE